MKNFVKMKKMIEKKTAINNNHQKKKKEKLTMLAVRKGERLKEKG